MESLYLRLRLPYTISVLLVLILLEVTRPFKLSYFTLGSREFNNIPLHCSLSSSRHQSISIRDIRLYNKKGCGTNFQMGLQRVLYNCPPVSKSTIKSVLFRLYMTATTGINDNNKRSHSNVSARSNPDGSVSGKDKGVGRDRISSRNSSTTAAGAKIPIPVRDRAQLNTESKVVGSRGGGDNPRHSAERKPKATSAAASKAVRKNNGGNSALDEGVRLNKCLLGLSRRAADKAIEEGRVTVNHKPAVCGTRVFSGDVVRLDKIYQRWEDQAKAKQKAPEGTLEERSFVYLKFWKPKGVTSTSNRKDPCNIIQAGRFDLFPQRLFTVGRLDKDSTGLILLTSDGRVNNAMLSPRTKKEKVYEVALNSCPTEAEIEKLRSGVTITTTLQKESGWREITVRTLPCSVARIGGNRSKTLRFTLMEGRNRQIRKMVQAIGYEVERLHRISFSGITLKGITEGEWMELTEGEMKVIQEAVAVSAGGSDGHGNTALLAAGDPEVLEGVELEEDE